MNIDYKEKALEIHQANIKKGFYDNPKSELMLSILIKSEVYEAFEAYRANRFADKEWTIRLHENLPGTIINFERYIKDTFEDELADIWIRCMDAYGYALSGGISKRHIAELNKKHEADNDDELREAFKGISSNFIVFDFVDACEDLMQNERPCISGMLSIVEGTANALNIDIEKHIDLKLNYNASRPSKHGKKF